MNGISNGVLTYTEDQGDNWQITRSADGTFIYYGPYDEQKIGKSLSAEFYFLISPDYSILEPSSIPIKISPININDNQQEIFIKLQKKQPPNGEKLSLPEKIEQKFIVKSSFGGRAITYSNLNINDQQTNELISEISKKITISDPKINQASFTQQASDFFDKKYADQPDMTAYKNEYIQKSWKIISTDPSFLKNEIKKSIGKSISDKVGLLKENINTLDLYTQFFGEYDYNSRTWGTISGKAYGHTGNSRFIKLNPNLSFNVNIEIIGTGVSIPVEYSFEIELKYSVKYETGIVGQPLDKKSPSISVESNPTLSIEDTTIASLNIPSISFLIGGISSYNVELPPIQVVVKAGIKEPKLTK